MGNADTVSRPTVDPQSPTPAPEIVIPGKDLYETGVRHLSKQSFAEASENFIQAMQLNHQGARVALAKMYLSGKGHEASFDTALSLLNEGMGTPGGEVELLLGVVHLRGQYGFPEDLAMAIQHFQAAIGLGNKEAQAHFGFMHVEGNGVTQNVELGLQLLKEVADVSAEANNYLGYMYTEGIGIPVDYKKAWEYYNDAVAKGHLDAAINLAQLYFNGWVPGLARNPQKALKCVTYAAEKGHSTAIAYLGLMFRDGVGVPQDLEKAFKLFTKSSKMGDTLGLYCYAKFLLDKGADVELDWESIIDLYVSATTKSNTEGEKFESFYIDGLNRVFTQLEK